MATRHFSKDLGKPNLFGVVKGWNAKDGMQVNLSRGKSGEMDSMWFSLAISPSILSMSYSTLCLPERLLINASQIGVRF